MAGNVAYFEDTSNGSHKFYLMEEDTSNATFTARWGSIGSYGSIITYPMSKWNSTIKTRIRHGYTEMTQAYLAGQAHVKPTQFQSQCNGKKYNMTGVRQTITVDGMPVNVYRIEATCDFKTVEGGEVLAGDMGGWVENAYNLSQDGQAWVDNNAVVYGSGRVEDDALVADDAICEGVVSGSAVVRGHAKIERAAQCMDNCLVCDDAIIEERAAVCDFVTVAEKGVVIAETVAKGDRYISKRTYS